MKQKTIRVPISFLCIIMSLVTPIITWAEVEGVKDAESTRQIYVPQTIIEYLNAHSDRSEALAEASQEVQEKGAVVSYELLKPALDDLQEISASEESSRDVSGSRATWTV